MARTPFKMKSGNSTPFKQMGSSPAKHRKDESWTGHEHKTKLGKLTGKIARGVKKYKEGGQVGHDFNPTDWFTISKEKGLEANISRPTRYTKDYGWETSEKGDLFRTKKDPTTGKRTTKILGREVRPSSNAWKKDAKPGESKYQYNIRKRKRK